MQLSPLKKIDMVLFVESTPKRMEMKDIDSQIKGRRIYLKSLPGTKSKQLNYYVERALNNTNMIVP